ncbi:MAG: IS630 transposase-related protein [Verrucomicrobiota bacterium]
MRAYSVDIRQKILRSLQSGKSQSRVAKDFGVSRKTICIYWGRYKERGEIYCKQHGGHRVSKISGYQKELKKWLEQTPGLTLKQLIERLLEKYDITLTQRTLHYHLKKMGYSFKKNVSGQRTWTR